MLHKIVRESDPEFIAQTAIVNDDTKKTRTVTNVVTKRQIVKLQNHMFKNMKIQRNGEFNLLDPKCDTRTAYFTKAHIDKFFENNPGSDGLFIFFAMHDDKIYRNCDPENYDNKLMAILVSSKQGAPSLNPKATVSITNPHYGDDDLTGMDNGLLCPPDLRCPVPPPRPGTTIIASKVKK